MGGSTTQQTRIPTRAQPPRVETQPRTFSKQILLLRLAIGQKGSAISVARPGLSGRVGRRLGNGQDGGERTREERKMIHCKTVDSYAE